MKKQLKKSTVYQPNKTVKVTVVNKPVFDEVGVSQGFDVDVTLKLKLHLEDELKFATDEDLASFVNAIDYSDPQQPLPMSRR